MPKFTYKFEKVLKIKADIEEQIKQIGNVMVRRYDLEYTDSSLSISTTYSGADDKLKISGSLELEYVKSIKFAFDDSINLLISEINYLSNKTIRYSYVVRALS